MAGLLGKQGQDQEPQVPVFQKPADAAATFPASTMTAKVFAQVSAEAMTTAMFVFMREVSMHFRSYLDISILQIYLTQIGIQ